MVVAPEMEPAGPGTLQTFSAIVSVDKKVVSPSEVYTAPLLSHANKEP